MSTVKPVKLRCEYEVTPLGLTNTEPLFSWEFDAPGEKGRQTAYRIMAAYSSEDLEDGAYLVWDTGKVSSSRNFGIEYEGRELKSADRVYWRVCMWDENGEAHVSEPTWFEMGLLNESDWKGDWMSFLGGMIGNGQLYRYSYDCKEKPVKARAYIAAVGYYDLHMNGKKVGDKLLEPGAVDYSKTILYSAYDITDGMTAGLNTWGVTLGTGWAGGPKFKMQVNLSYADGSTEEFHTEWGTGWTVARGPITYNAIYDGEDFDARMIKKGWTTPEYEDEYWRLHQRPDGFTHATIVENPGGKLTGEIMPPVRVEKTFKPVQVLKGTDGADIYDFGLNMSGWAEIKVHGSRGARVSMQFGEVLNDQGDLNMVYYRSARSMDNYILSGEGEESYEPTFTYHGFQYVAVRIEGDAVIDEITAKFAHTDLTRNVSFECDDPFLNRMQETMLHTDLCNMFSIPTDCAQRDERHGWATDTTARAEGSIYHFDMASFFDKWMNDILDSQREDGYFADTAPYRWGRRPCDPQVNTPISLPLLMYRYYGDKKVIRDSYDKLHKYIQRLLIEAKDMMIARTGFGEWACPISECYYEEFGANAASKMISPEFVSTAYLYYSITEMEEMARIIGREEAEYYRTLGAELREKFNRKYFNEVTCQYDRGTQSANSLAIQLGIAPEDKIPAIVKNIVDDIMAHDIHLTTGSMGTRAMMEMLSRYGEVETIYQMILQKTAPGFGYMLEKGATTMWEKWQADIDNDIMNSHNQPMLSSCAIWFYKWLAGIQLDDIGMSKVRIAPAIPSGIHHVKCGVDTMNGRVEVEWKRGENFAMEVTIPYNTDAVIVLQKEWGSGNVQIPEDVTVKETETSIEISAGSGNYTFMI